MNSNLYSWELYTEGTITLAEMLYNVLNVILFTIGITLHAHKWTGGRRMYDVHIANGLLLGSKNAILSSAYKVVIYGMKMYSNKRPHIGQNK